MLSPKVDHSNQSHIIADSDLISYICDVNIDDLKGYISEHSDCINQYYEYYPISNNNDDTYENNSNDENKVLPMIVTPLLLAVSLGSLAIVSILVSQYQADINLPLMINGEQHDLQQTPLYIACSKNHIAIVSLLLNTNHADISISDKHGISPFFIACMNGNTAIVDILVKYMNLDQTGMLSVSQMHESRIEPYIDSLGRTPLYLACFYNKLEVVELLLNYTDFVEMLNIPNVNGETPLYAATVNKHYDIVKYLLLKEDKNIHINHCDRNGDTCLHKACKLAYDNSTNPAKHHRLAIAMLLIEHGGNIYACNENNLTPMAYVTNFDDKLMLEKASIWGKSRSRSYNALFNVCTRTVFKYYHNVLDQTCDVILNGTGVAEIVGAGRGSGACGNQEGSDVDGNSNHQKSSLDMPNGAIPRDIIVELEQEELANSGAYRSSSGSFSPTSKSYSPTAVTVHSNSGSFNANRGPIPPIGRMGSGSGMDGLGSVDGFNMGLEEYDDNSILNMHLHRQDSQSHANDDLMSNLDYYRDDGPDYGYEADEYAV